MANNNRQTSKPTSPTVSSLFVVCLRMMIDWW